MSGDIIVAFSGGKDSTAMALSMAERGEKGKLFFTPAGNEPHDLFDHIGRVCEMIGWELIQPKAPTLFELIDNFDALPNWRQRWCTRMIKILPCIAYLKEHPGSTLCVGLRSDEEERQGLYGDYAEYRYPLREYGWGVDDVYDYLKEKQVELPKRTDCMLCFGQRLDEWYFLWKDRPKEYQHGIELEARIGHTFRSAGRDTWPAGLEELAQEFKKGRLPRGIESDEQGLLFPEDDEKFGTCRVCRF
jgi:3'-phosphoadenosine 5'-phosphosulfate sulfotransferase (PAPS reductase)/FAD synthetase